MTQTPPTSTTPPTPATSPTPPPARAARLRALARRVFTLDVLAHGLFWSWNLIFLAVVYAGLLPHHLVDILLEVLDGTVPLNLAFSAFLLCAIPLVSTVVGALYFRRQPRKLLRLFYGLEGPLMFAALVRLFLFRELPPVMVFLVVALSLCLVSYGVELVRGDSPAGRATAWALHLGASLSLLGCLYAVSVLSFYAPPVAWALTREFFSFGWVRELWNGLRHQHGMGLVMLPLSLVLFAYTASLFAALPVAMLALYVGLYRRTLRALSAHAGALRPLVATGLLIAVTTALFVRLNHQPQREVLNRLAQPPQSDAERLALRRDAEAIRQGLLAAYLAPHRYLSSVGSNDHIETIYRTVLHVPKRAAQRLQLAYNALAAPILYDGPSTHADRSAAEQYVATFDLSRHTTMYLTYWTAGDTRNRGAQMHAFVSAYRDGGVLPPKDEAPDHLPVVLEFAAAVDPEAGRRLLIEHRVPIDLLHRGLVERGSPYADAIGAVCTTLPAPTDQEVQRARRLAEDGPPAEAVGLQPFTLTVPPRRTEGVG